MVGTTTVDCPGLKSIWPLRLGPPDVQGNPRCALFFHLAKFKEEGDTHLATTTITSSELTLNVLNVAYPFLFSLLGSR